MRWITNTNECPVPTRLSRRLFRWTALAISAWTGTVWPCSCHAGTTNYLVRGVLRGIRQDERQLVISHEDIPHFMAAMTMPFPVNGTAILTNVAIGDQIVFRLHVTENDCWVDHVERLAVAAATPASLSAPPDRTVVPESHTPISGPATN